MVVKRELHRFSVSDYERMIKSGILDESDKVELIRGEIVQKMPKGDPHVACLKRLIQFVLVRFADRSQSSIQDPLRLADSEPEPDMLLLQPRADYYASGKPVPADVLLLVEVADSSLDYDRTVKRLLYAENAITEYWIADVVHDRLEVFRHPQPDGSYAFNQLLQAGESIDLLAFPGQYVQVSDLFG